MYSSIKVKLCLEWPSGWVEPEIGRSTLGLSRVEHSTSARRIEPDKHFWPSGLNEFGLSFDKLNRTQRLVRRIKSNRHTCSSSTQSEFRLIQKSRIGWPTLGLDDQFCPTGWAKQAILSDGLAWVVNSCPSPSPGLAWVPWP
jgi:hypothetical protein